jgi:hypothetical protein
MKGQDIFAHVNLVQESEATWQSWQAICYNQSLMKRRVAFFTLGCKLNFSESSELEGS